MGSSSSKRTPRLTYRECLDLISHIPYSSVNHVAKVRMVLKALNLKEASITTATWLRFVVSVSERFSNYRERWYQWKEWKGCEIARHFIMDHPSYLMWYQLMGGDMNMNSTIDTASPTLKDLNMGTLYSVAPPEDIGWWWNGKSDNPSSVPTQGQTPELELRRQIAAAVGYVMYDTEGVDREQLQEIRTKMGFLDPAMFETFDPNLILQQFLMTTSALPDEKYWDITLWYHRKAVKSLLTKLERTKIDKEGLAKLLPYLPDNKTRLKVEILSEFGEHGRVALCRQSPLCYILGIPLNSNPSYPFLLRRLRDALKDRKGYQERIENINRANLQHFAASLPHLENAEIDLDAEVPSSTGSRKIKLREALKYPPFDLIPVENDGKVTYIIRKDQQGLEYCYLMAATDCSARNRVAISSGIPPAAPFYVNLVFMSSIIYLSDKEKKKRGD